MITRRLLGSTVSDSPVSLWARFSRGFLLCSDVATVARLTSGFPSPIQTRRPRIPTTKLTTGHRTTIGAALATNGTTSIPATANRFPVEEWYGGVAVAVGCFVLVTWRACMRDELFTTSSASACARR